MKPIEIFGEGFSWTEFCQISVLFAISRVDATFRCGADGRISNKKRVLGLPWVSKDFFLGSDEMMRWCGSDLPCWRKKSVAVRNQPTKTLKERLEFTLAEINDQVIQNDLFIPKRWRSLNPWKGHLTIPKGSRIESPGICFFSQPLPLFQANQKSSQTARWFKSWLLIIAFERAVSELTHSPCGTKRVTKSRLAYGMYFYHKNPTIHGSVNIYVLIVENWSENPHDLDSAKNPGFV